MGAHFAGAVIWRILWLVTLIPIVLFVLAIFVIGKYELSDEKIDELNAAVTKR